MAHLSAKEGTSRWVYSGKLIMMIGPMLLVPNGYLDCRTAIPLAITIWMKFLSTSQKKKKKICKILYHFIQILKFLVQMYLIFLTPQMNIFNKKNLCATTINLIYDYYDFLVEFVVCFYVKFFFSFPLCAWTKPLLNNRGQCPPPLPPIFFLIISIYSY